MVVCRTCHDAHHAGTLTIGPVKQTSTGPQRVIEHVSKPNPNPLPIVKSKGDLSEEDIAHIVEIAKENPSLSTKLLLFQIKDRYGLEVSSTQIATLRRRKII